MLSRRFTVVFLLSTLGVLSLLRARVQRHRAQALCARLSASAPARSDWFRGALFVRGDGRIAVRDPVWVTKFAEIPFSGDVLLEPPLGSRGPEFGRLVRVSGPFRCAVPRRNPGRVADGGLDFASPRIVARGDRFRVSLDNRPASWLSRFQSGFRDALSAGVRRWPELRGLAFAVWTGDASGLPPSLVTFYREAGLLPVLALSGQHVALLLMLIGGGLSIGKRLLPSISPRVWFRRGLPLACAGLLWVTSGGAPSVLRTFALLGALFLLHARGMRTSLVQATATSVALALVMDPDLAAQPGFVLSAAATALLGYMASGARMNWREALFVGACLPILVFPLTAFFFAKVSWAASLHSLVLGAAWGALWIPLGFLLPLLGVVLPDSLAGLLREAWFGWLRFDALWASWVPTLWTTVVRPTAIELLAIEIALVVLALSARRVFIDDPSA